MLKESMDRYQDAVCAREGGMDALRDRAMPTRRDSRDLGGAADAEVAPDVHRDFYGELFYSTI
jgi:hypothetical protein